MKIYRRVHVLVIFGFPLNYKRVLPCGSITIIQHTNTQVTYTIHISHTNTNITQNNTTKNKQTKQKKTNQLTKLLKQ
jgi:hypothetical protein